VVGRRLRRKAALVSLWALAGVLLFTGAALAAPPEVPVTKPATAITGTGATLNGELNPKAKVAQPVEYDFSYKQSATECTEGTVAPEAPVKATGKPKEGVSVKVTGLEPSREYTFCVIAKRGVESNTGLPVMLKTAAAPPIVASESVSSVKATEATLEAQVNPNNQETTYVFEYANEETMIGTLGATKLEGAGPLTGFGDQTASVSTGALLTPATTYYYRVIARNAASEEGKGKIEHFTTALPPEKPETKPATEVTATAAKLNGVLNPQNVGEAGSYEFIYRQSASECQGENEKVTTTAVALGHKEETVSTAVMELLPHTQYTFCVIARNEAGETALAAPVTFTTLAAAPKIDAYIADVTSSSATLSATINPEGAATTYTFEYAPGGGAFTPVPEPAAKGSVAAGTVGVPVSVHVQSGLLPNTSYEFRLVAGNSVETVTSEPIGFTTEAIGGELVLPDSREWELVSPPDKHGANIESIGEQGVIQAAAGGAAVSYLATAPTEAEPPSYSNNVQVLSTRGPGGWASRDITVPHDAATGASVGRGEEYRAFSSDLSLGILQPFGKFMASLSAEASEQTAYLRTNYLNGDVNQACTGSCFRPLVTGKPGYENVPSGTVFGLAGGKPCPPEFSCGPEFVGATPDLGHVVVSSGVGLTAGTSGGLYEWAGGKLTFIGVGDLGDNGVAARHAISDDGSRVVFSTGGGEGPLYMRDVVHGETAQLDAVQGGTGEGAVKPHFEIAASDGSKAFFTDVQRLTEGAGASFGEPDLYECEMVREAGKLKCKLSDLTPLSAGTSASVQGAVLGASEDGLWVYFVANAVLAPGAVHGECSSSGGHNESPPGATCNLYVRHAGGPPKLVAILSAEDLPDWGRELPNHTSRVSPKGEWLTFMSQANLTGYDNRDVVSGYRDEEVYLYHAATGALVCASCNPTGARPAGVEYRHLQGVQGGIAGGNSVWAPTTWIAANVPGWTPYRLSLARYQSRYLSDSGRLFFNSSDALVPQDINGTEDVYQYEPAELGSCTTASVTFGKRSSGCVGLISSGSSTEESAFLDASESGGDVFFLTSARLSSQDVDTSLDVYDAHSCTGAAPCFPVLAAQSPPCSTGDSCRPSPTPQPSIFGAPSSATLSGPGNLTPTSESPSKPKTAAQVRAEKLAKALKLCKKDKSKKRRVACERAARKKYGAVKAKRSAKKSNHRRAR